MASMIATPPLAMAGDIRPVRLLETKSVPVDFSKAVRPTRSYGAELCSVQFQRDEAHLIFGQTALVGAAWDSALVIRMHDKACWNLLDSIDRMKVSVETIVSELQIAREPLTTVEENPRQVVKLVANVAQLAISGHESSIDFYQILPLSMHETAANKHVPLEPIARVDLHTGLLLPIVDELRLLRSKYDRYKAGESHE